MSPRQIRKISICLLSIITTFNCLFFQMVQTQPPAGPGNGSTTKVCGTTKEAKSMNYSMTTDDSKGTNTGYPGGYITINTDNCPDYDWTSQSTPNKAMVFNRVVKLPLQPKISTSKVYVGIKDGSGNTNSKPIMGAIGVSVNGIAIFGNANDQKNDAYINEAHTFDKCGGHPEMHGEYHYHEEPPQGCAYTDTAGKHSPLFGLMYDGIPIFGSLGDNGVAPTDLDECGGHVDKTYNFYHYHLPKNLSFPYTVSCLKGCFLYNQGNFEINNYVKSLSSCTQDSKQYDYTQLFSNINTFFRQYGNSINSSNGNTPSTTNAGNSPVTSNVTSTNSSPQINTNLNNNITFSNSTTNINNTTNQNQPNLDLSTDYLPPEISTNSDKIKNINNNDMLTKLKLIMANLPIAEQNVIADCITSNTDSTRLIDSICYKNNFSQKLKVNMAKAISDKLTTNSIFNRQALSCLSKVSNNFGLDTDNSKQLINTDINNIVALQTSLNSASAAFSKVIIEIFNAKRRQLLTTKDNINSLISSSDASGNAQGLIFTEDELKSIIASFKTYANFVFNYISNYQSKVNSIEGMIGYFDSCKVQQAKSKRVLQQTGNSNMNSTINSVQINTKENSNNTNSVQSQGGRPKAVDGRPQSKISTSIQALKDNIISGIQKKTSDNSWNSLSTRIDSNLDGNSAFKPKPSLIKLIISRIQNSTVIKNEFDKIVKNTACDKDYLLICSDGTCSCLDPDCPSEIKGTRSISIDNRVNLLMNKILYVEFKDKLRYLQSTPNTVNYQNNDNINSFYLSSFCLSGQRYFYSDADMGNSGKSIDIGNSQGVQYGKDYSLQLNSCSELFLSGTNSDKINCRGQINDDCSKKLDDSCKSQGLYDFLIKNPISSDPLPVECNDRLSSYSDLSCFQWLIPRISRGTLVFDYKLFLDLPYQIAVSNGSKSSTIKRLLQSSSTAIKIGVDPSSKDSIAVISSNIYKLSDSDLKVDSATPTEIPSTTSYITDLTVKTNSINLSSQNPKWIGLSLFIISLLIF